MTSVTIPTFETERLTLRGPSLDDAVHFAAFVASDRSKYIGGPGSDLSKSTRAFGHAAGLWVLRGYGPHTICKKDGTPIGMAGPWFPQTWPEPEFGWSLWDMADEGKGYIQEAMRVLKAWTWETLKLQTVVAYIHPDNVASIRVAERLGASLDIAANAPDTHDLVYRFYPAVAE